MRSTKALAPWVRKSEYIMISGWARRSFFADVKNYVSAKCEDLTRSTHDLSIFSVLDPILRFQRVFQNQVPMMMVVRMIISMIYFDAYAFSNIFQTRFAL